MRYVTMLKIKFDTEAAFHNFYNFIHSKILCLKDIDVRPYDNDDDEEPPKSEVVESPNSAEDRSPDGEHNTTKATICPSCNGKKQIAMGANMANGFNYECDGTGKQ